MSPLTELCVCVRQGEAVMLADGGSIAISFFFVHIQTEQNVSDCNKYDDTVKRGWGGHTDTRSQ